MKTNTDLLIHKYLQGAISPTEEAELMRWVNEEEDNKREFEEYIKTWELSGKALTPDFSTNDEWEKLSDTLNISQSDGPKLQNNEPKAVNRFRTLNPWIIGVAAAVSLFFVIYLVLSPVTENNEVLQIVQSAESEIKEISLPDGSTVWLNINSKIIYPEGFKGDQRQVALEGEAFFEVAKDPSKPFVIQTGNVITKVLGTSFNLKTSGEGHIIEIVVVSGKVGFYNENEPGNSLELTRGMKGIYMVSLDSLYSTEDINADFLDWKDDKLVFNNASLKEVVETLNSKFDVEIEVSDKALLDCKFTSTFEKANLRDILNVIAYSLELKYTQEGKKVTLLGKGC